MNQVQLKIVGMTCAGCASKIEQEVQGLETIQKASINFATETGRFQFSNPEDIEKIKKTIRDLGYSSAPMDEAPLAKGMNSHLHQFLVAIVLALIIFMLEMGPLKNWPNTQVNAWLQWVAATPVWIWVGFRFQKALVVFFTKGHSNMNTLIGLGTSAAYIYSSFIAFLPGLAEQWNLTHKLYFEAIGFIISFVFLGQYFEEKSKRKTKEALNSLFKLRVKKALKIIAPNKTQLVSVSQLVKGDSVLVKTGEKFPVDGEILTGQSAVNEALVTGESLPVDKSPGDLVYGGTLNEGDPLEIKVKALGSESFLDQVIAFVERAQHSRPQIQKFADRIGVYFTPVVLGLGVLTFLLWLMFGPSPSGGIALSNFISVLVIACPCALGLATPTAVVVATGRASLKGILIAGGEVIEKGEPINLIMFDKTGTLTQGQPRVLDSKIKGSQDKILNAVLALESLSEHPLSKALVQYCQKQGVQGQGSTSQLVVAKGQGLEGSYKDQKFIIGKASYLKEHQINIDSALTSDKVGSLVYVATEAEHVATFIVGDPVKPEARPVIKEIKDQGIKTLMATGDNEAVASAVAKELNLDEFKSDLAPKDKHDLVLELQSQGYKVAMIGDGVNDAPALALADLSLAMGSGSDVAMSTADVTIVKGDLNKVLQFLVLSKKTMKVIRQNLFLSLVYNALLIPVAAGGLALFGGPFMPPVLASIAMALSSISVVGNSLRLRAAV